MIIGMADSVRPVELPAPAAIATMPGWQTPINSRYRILIKNRRSAFPSGRERERRRGPPRARPRRQTSRILRGRTCTSETACRRIPRARRSPSRSTISTASSFSGPPSTAHVPVMTRSEMDLLTAEGYIRTGDFANAMAKINVSRVAKGDLPPLTGITALGQADLCCGLVRSTCATAAEFHDGGLW